MTNDTNRPKRIGGRYTVIRSLGEGGFGSVFLAHDTTIDRQVAVKVPGRGATAESWHAYRKEAQAAARLDHPNIVQVFDVGGDEEYPCYIVTKFIDGIDLAAHLRNGRVTHQEAARIVCLVASALHHAHEQGVFHRDVKPANIVLDSHGTPYVLDFGLALREEERGLGSRHAGTPDYMSPEQARGEGHLVTGRSDVFSLGIVFYELLTGQRPFRGPTSEAVREQIVNGDLVAPRQLDDDIPKELDRICLRALARRATERYATAGEFADDIRRSWLQPLSADPVGIATAEVPSAFGGTGVHRPLPEAFISHAKPDAAEAEQLCQLLESHGVRCWIAPRDVSPGGDYREAIIDAIDATPIVLLLLSDESNKSIHVSKEIERAVSKRKRVVPIRLREVLPSKALELHLSSTQWVDAWNVSPKQLAGTLMRLFRADAPPPSLPSEVSVNPPTAAPPPTPSSTKSEEDQALIQPKGPRAFVEEDSANFLRLLPGPRDRDGLPDGARFWKTRIDSREPDLAFRVGLIYGPSGCGKTSRVRAGLLPRLARHVVPLYVESAVGETEARLLRELYRKVPKLPAGLSLVDAMSAVRRGTYLPAGRKLTIFLDQFEQWLHSTREDDNAELVQALRQCDGVRLQCVLMVRDEFWLAVSRFMKALEVRIVEEENARLIDLFDVPHAREVLTLFGQALNRLPRSRAAITPQQHQFIKLAAEDLAEEGKVVSVRLALFADMVKDKEWTPATLKAVGGIKGVGVTFLEEKFTSRHAPPRYKAHQEAAQNVLRALLPAEGTEIKGHRRSVHELLEQSTYASEPKKFDDLLHILDAELRLISPADSDAARGVERSGVAPVPCYQLTHDYLVPQLLEWLTRKQKETRRGRAELMLDDYATVWNSRPKNRNLPSMLQWLQVVWYVPRRNRTDGQRRMMRKANRYHIKRVLIAAALFLGLAYAGFEYRQGVKSNALLENVIRAETVNLETVLKEAGPYRPWLNPRMQAALANETARGDTQARLNLSLALLPDDPSQAEYLHARMLRADPGTVVVLTKALEPHKGPLLESLWAIADRPDGDRGEHLRAAAALARYDPTSPRWSRISGRVVQELLFENPIHLGAWVEAFYPVRYHVIAPLLESYRQPLRAPVQTKVDPNGQPYTIEAQYTSDLEAAGRASKRSIAAKLLLNYAKEDPKFLTEGLLDSDENHFPTFIEALRERQDESVKYLLATLTEEWKIPNDPDETERRAKRVANAGIYLILMGKPQSVWPLLALSADPRVRSYLIARMGRLGVDPSMLLGQLTQELDSSAADRVALGLPDDGKGRQLYHDVTIARALTQALGWYPERAVPPDASRLVRRMFETSTDPGLHASAEWLLRKWNHESWLVDTTRKWAATGRSERQERESQITAEFRSYQDQGGRRPTERWFVTSQGHTMVALPGPIEFRTGSPENEFGRLVSEKQYDKRIARSFAISSKLTTVGQYDAFPGGRAHTNNLPHDFHKDPTQPVVRVTWVEVAKYCNWLTAQEGLGTDQYCYNFDDKGNFLGYPANYLARTGYRMPTEAEMEYANRARTQTCRYYGETEDLLGDYAWYQKNSGEITHPVGTQLPNDFGLFDVQGNAFTWCHDRTDDAKRNEPDDRSSPAPYDERDKRVLRGGAFYFMAISLRAARRHDDVPTMQGLYYGFRVAKTLK